MQLHVLGPAFGHPSIDAECAAAIAILRTHSLSTPIDYQIVPSHDYSNTLPYLIDDSKTITGYNAIADHLTSRFPPQARPNPHQKADTTALLSFIHSQAPALTNTSLYVSAENYRTTTRPAFTALLPRHANYILPPRRRAAARAATAHLGISSIDVDDVHEDTSNRPPSLGGDVGKNPQEGGFEKESRERASLLLPRKQTLKGLLGGGERGAVFRLHALAEGFLEPMSEWLGEGEVFLGGEEVGVVDCLAYGYLGLMLRGEGESRWLRALLGKGGKYARLGRFVERVEGRLGLKTKVEDVMELAKCKTIEDVEGRRKALEMTLPWMPPAKSTPLETASDIATELWTYIPYLGGKTTTVQPIHPDQRPWYSQYLQPILLAVTASMALGGYWAFSTGLLIWPHGEQMQVFGRKRLADYGHLGAALSGLSLLGQQAGMDRRYQELSDGARVQEGVNDVEVVVEGDGKIP